MRNILLIICFAIIIVAKGQSPESGYLVKIHDATSGHIDTMSGAEGGHLIYNTDSNSLYFYNGTDWISAEEDDKNELVEDLVVRADSTFIYQDNGDVVAAENDRRVYMGQFLINAKGKMTINKLPFKPNLVEFTAFNNVDAFTLDADNGVGNNDRGIDNSFGYMKGYAQLDGKKIRQQVIGGGGHGNSINDISRYASIDFCIGLRYADQNGTKIGLTTAEMLSFDKGSFTINVKDLDDNVVVMYTAYR